MPARQLWTPARAEDPYDDLARLVVAMSPAQLDAFAASLDAEDLAMLEQVMGDRMATTWRSTPDAMAAHLTRGKLRRWRYVRLLGDAFRRAVEGISTRQIWNLPSRYGKPVEVNQLVLMEDGSRRRLGDVVVGDWVMTDQGRSCRVLAVHDQGELPVVEIRTACGRRVIAARDHPFLTARGWIDAEDLLPSVTSGDGDIVAVLSVPVGGASARCPEEFRLAGYFIGDGSVTISRDRALSAHITCFDEVEADDLRVCAKVMGWRVGEDRLRGRFAFRRGENASVVTGPRPWLREAGIAGSGSRSKRVPPWVFTASPEMVAEFVGAYFACDGTVSRKPLCLEFYSMSRGLLADVQHLLLRLGISSRLAAKYAAMTNFTGGPVHSWRLSVAGSDNVARFRERIHPRSVKNVLLSQLPVVRQSFDSSYKPDGVRAVDDAGMAECRCLTVEDDATFTAGDLVVHNSTIGSRWGPAWCLDRTMGAAKIILTSYGDDLANENAVSVRDILNAHADVLRAELRFDRRRMDRFVTEEGGGVLAAGINSGIAGFGAGDGGGVVIDDPFKNWVEAHRASTRDNVWMQFRGVLRLRLDSDDAWIIVIHTRWHEDDLTGRLVKESEDETGEKWELIRLPAIAEPHDPTAADPTLRQPDPLGREPGEVLEPERFNLPAVEARARALGSYLSAGLEQQRPAPPEGKELLRDWFVLYEAGEGPRAPEAAISSWDLKLKDREAGDFVVGQVWWRTAGAFWLIDQLRGGYDHATTANAIALLAVRHPEVTEHRVEAAGSADEVIPELRRAIDHYVVTDEMAARLGMTRGEREQVQLLRRRGMARITAKAAVGDKSVRARAYIAPNAEAGLVRLPADAPFTPGLLEELTTFPDGTHDDQVDTMSQALKRLAGGVATGKAPSGALPSVRPSTALPRTGGLPSPLAGRRGSIR